MGRPTGTKLPERINDDWLAGIQSEFPARDDMALRRLLSAAAHELARRSGFKPSTTPGAYTDEQLIAFLVDTDRRCFEATQCPLTTGVQYSKHKAPGAPAIGTYYRRFGKPFERALAAAGLTPAPQPISALTRLTGRPAGGRSFTREICIVILAEAIDHFARLGTIRVSQSDYDLIYRALRRVGRVSEAPSSTTICSHSKLGGKGGSWDEMHDVAFTHIVANPLLYPAAHALITRKAA